MENTTNDALSTYCLQRRETIALLIKLSTNDASGFSVYSGCVRFQSLTPLYGHIQKACKKNRVDKRQKAALQKTDKKPRKGP